jgi:hypothetical protein
MKRAIITFAAVFFLGLLVGAAAIYFLVTRTQTQMIQQFYAVSLTDRVIIAARLRAGMEQKVLAESDQLIGSAAAGIRGIADGTAASRHALQMARAYFDYSGIPIPATAQPVLAQVEPASRKTFEALRDMQLAADP